ncbi:hypothetical protein [Emticicia sp. C21]|uniref:hypothetical protein n=1 Tax=Emticicia sp. C21 TaxID=2302915 RepID=UPI000E34EB85|nr:hypothetical protein [Emticicia sp. C21]RFS18343.1 hypothetical protein D0T08_03595 [Emticicia sp. C21]
MKPRKVKLNCPFFRIVSDGSISNVSVGEGRLIPSLVIDTGNHFEINELIKLHKDTLPGDSITTWGLPDTFFKPKNVFLSLNFIKPMKIDFAIEFSLVNHCATIDGIIHANAFYLQVGKKGDKVSEQKNDSIMIEVSSTDFREKWEQLFFYTVKEKFCKKLNLSKKEEFEMTTKIINKMRDAWKLRR